MTWISEGITRIIDQMGIIYFILTSLVVWVLSLMLIDIDRNTGGIVKDVNKLPSPLNIITKIVLCLPYINIIVLCIYSFLLMVYLFIILVFGTSFEIIREIFKTEE